MDEAFDNVIKQAEGFIIEVNMCDSGQNSNLTACDANAWLECCSKLHPYLTLSLDAMHHAAVCEEAAT